MPTALKGALSRAQGERIEARHSPSVTKHRVRFADTEANTESEGRAASILEERAVIGEAARKKSYQHTQSATIQPPKRLRVVIRKLSAERERFEGRRGYPIRAQDQDLTSQLELAARSLVSVLDNLQGHLQSALAWANATHTSKM